MDNQQAASVKERAATMTMKAVIRLWFSQKENNNNNNKKLLNTNSWHFMLVVDVKSCLLNL